MDNNHELLPDLRVFTSVVEQSSFTGAAKQLGTSTAAISRSIRRLEQELGGPLLHRTTRRVGLTEMGARLYGQAHERLRDLERALDDVKSSGKEARGLLRVTCAQTFGRRFVKRAVFDFRILYPEIDIELSLCDDVADLVASGFHIAIRGGQSSYGRHIARPLAPAPLYTCAAPEVLKRFAPPRRPDDFRALPCIGFRFRSTGEKLAWKFVENDQDLIIDVKSGLWLDDTEVVCEAAQAGLGFAQLPGYVALDAIRDGRLIPVLPQTAATDRSFSLIHLDRSDKQPLRDRLFVEHLLRSASDKSLFQFTEAEFHEYEINYSHILGFSSR